MATYDRRPSNFKNHKLQYKPRWGYKRTKDDQNDWLIEVGPNDDPYEDQFAKRKNAKKARILKNQSQEVANLERQVRGLMLQHARAR